MGPIKYRKGIYKYKKHFKKDRKVKSYIEYDSTSSSSTKSFYFDDDFKKHKLHLVKVRDAYYHHLSTIVKDNFQNSSSNILNEELLNKICTSLEQKAIVAAIQVGLYQEALNAIIRDIKVYTRKGHLFPSFLLKEDLALRESKTPQTIKIEKKSPIQTSLKNKVPRSKLESNSNSKALENQSTGSNSLSLMPMLNKNTLQQSLQHVTQNSNNPVPQSVPFSSLTVVQNSLPCVNYSQLLPRTNQPTLLNEYSLLDQSSLINQTQLEKKSHVLSYPPTHLSPPVIPLNQNLLSTQSQPLYCFAVKPVSRVEPHQWNTSETVNDNIEAELLHILGGSDDEMEKKTVSKTESICSKLEKLKHLFGADEYENDEEQTIQKSNITSKHNHSKRRNNNTWSHERHIHMFTFSNAFGNFNEEEKDLMRSKLEYLFGDDSDDERLNEFICPKQLFHNCVQRIIPCVVQCLMPYYRERKIIGRYVFKTMAKFVSEKIIQLKSYPNEIEIQQAVDDYFITDREFKSEEDVYSIDC